MLDIILIEQTLVIQIHYNNIGQYFLIFILLQHDFLFFFSVESTNKVINTIYYLRFVNITNMTIKAINKYLLVEYDHDNADFKIIKCHYYRVITIFNFYYFIIL